jgi:iduronate 2-sulfatase
MKILFRYPIIWFLFLVGFAQFAFAAGSPKLNVLFIIADDLRDTVGCYGNTMVKTPNIDRLAKRGVRFDRAYVQYPVCNPSRSSFLTGLRAEQTGVVANSTMLRTQLPDVVTLPQCLKENGWFAAGFGKIFHLGGRDDGTLSQWMDLPKSWNVAEEFEMKFPGHVIEGRNLTGDKLKWCRWGATDDKDADMADGYTASAAIDVMEKNSDKPWMICAGFHRPHDPFVSPKKYFDLYPEGSLKIYHDPKDITPVPPLAMQSGAFQKAFDKFTDKERMEFQRAYYAGVSFMDAQVGRLMDELDRRKLWDRTVVIFSGDNGYHHNERNWWNKNTLFERSCRVPLIVCAPDAKAGTVCRSLVEFVDLYPTMLDYCGLKAPHELTGKSFRPLLKKPSSAGKSEAFTLVVRGNEKYGQTIRTERWRFTRWSDNTTELYDENIDPEETHNVASKPEHAKLVKELSAKIGGLPKLKNAAKTNAKSPRKK